MIAMALNRTGVAPHSHPNEFDRKRIERALKARKRYRYVSPSVAAVAGGYRIESPCCSRNIDPEGGVVDIALVIQDSNRGTWQLFRKDHVKGVWEADCTFDRLVELLDLLNADPERKFWQ
jgi:hypothetical protein